MNWDDARFLLAVARGGTLAGAARSTQADATTVARRLDRLERSLGGRLFERVGGRLVLTAAGQSAMRHAAEAERALREFAAVASAADSGEGGTVRISAVGTLLTYFLIPRLREFTKLNPHLVPELIADTAHADLIQREADLALRMVRPETGSLVVKRLTRVAYAPYAIESLAGSLGREDCRRWPWLAYEPRFEHLPEARWWRQRAPGARIVARTTVGATAIDAVLAGLGTGMLPCYVAAAYPVLRPLLPPEPLRELWLVSDPTARRIPGIRAAHAWLSDVFERDRLLFVSG